MEVKWIGSPYFGYPDGTHGRNGYKPLAVVMHIAEGTLAGCDSWFNSPENASSNGGSSTTYAIGKNGEIHQYVSESDAAWGNGPVNRPSWPLLINGVNPNLYTISVEHEGHTGEPWTEKMLQADAWLIKQIAQRWNLPLDRDHVIGHYQIDAVNRPNCPGPGLPWDRLMSALNTPGPLEDQIKQLQQQVHTLQQQVRDLQNESASLQAKLSAIGRLVKTADSPQVYLLKSGVLYPLADQLTLDRLYSASLVDTVGQTDLTSLPRGPQITVS